MADKISIEFYRPEVVDGSFAEDVLKRIDLMDRLERIDQTNGVGIFDLKHNPAHRQYIGEAGKIRMQDFPAVVDTSSGDLDDLNIDDLKGLGEQIAFVYDVDLDVIGIQVRQMMRASTLKNFMKDLTNEEVEFQVILREDAMERFDRMSRPTSITFKLARPYGPVGDVIPTIGHALEMTKLYEGVVAETTVSVGRLSRSQNLDRKEVARTVENRDRFDKLQLKGYIRHASGPKIEKIDFVRDALREKGDVSYSTSGRRLNIESCQKAIRRALLNHKRYLKKYSERRL